MLYGWHIRLGAGHGRRGHRRFGNGYLWSRFRRRLLDGLRVRRHRRNSSHRWRRRDRNWSNRIHRGGWFRSRSNRCRMHGRRRRWNCGLQGRCRRRCRGNWLSSGRNRLRGNRCRWYGRLWRDRTRSRRHSGGAGQLQAPKTRRRLRELKLNVGASTARGLGLHHLANNLLFCLFVGEKHELAGSELRGSANHGAVGKNENGLRGFGKRNALIRAIHGTRPVDRNRNLQGDGLDACGRFVRRLGMRSCSGSGVCGRGRGFKFFQNRRHRVLAQRGVQ